MENTTGRPKRALFVLYTRDRHEVLMHPRGPFYGLPTVPFETDSPSRGDVEQAFEKTVFVSPYFDKAVLVPLLEFEDLWDGQKTHFVIYEVRGIIVCSRLHPSILVSTDLPRNAGTPDFSAVKLHEMMSNGHHHNHAA